MRITFDPIERAQTASERGLDFLDARIVFEGVTVTFEDKRRNHGESPVACFGVLSGRMVVICYTPRMGARHIISMRKANEREEARLAPYLEV